MMISVNKNKWSKYKYMKGSVSLVPHLPVIEQFTQFTFENLIIRYKQVVLKPIFGSRGRGVIQVSDLGNGQYEIHLENRKITLQGRDAVYDYLKNIIGTNEYMVQQLVPRATINGRPFDMRVIVQRKRNSRNWKVTAKIAKVAGKGYIVSNITRSKGKLMMVPAALRKSTLRKKSIIKMQSEIDIVALLSARRLSDLFPSHRIYGLDIALDQNGHVWIIEANLYPAMSHFLKLKDKGMYHKIMAYKRV